MKDWVMVIDLLYPPINPLINCRTDCEVFSQWSAHEVFAVTLRQLFLRNPETREIACKSIESSCRSGMGDKEEVHGHSNSCPWHFSDQFSW